MTDPRAHLLLHLRSLQAAGVLFVPNGVPMIPTSSAPAVAAQHQFRRCNRCGGGNVFDFSPSTALPCPCGGEMLAAAVTVADVLAEREHCATCLENLAGKCEEAGTKHGGMVEAARAADHMRKLAAFYRTGGVPGKPQ